MPPGCGITPTLVQLVQLMLSMPFLSIDTGQTWICDLDSFNLSEGEGLCSTFDGFSPYLSVCQPRN